MKKLRQWVMIFSQNYPPIREVKTKRAITLLVKGKAEPINFIPGVVWEVKSPHLILLVPAHMRLYKARERKWQISPISKKEILRRDRYQCQYCRNKKNLTIDHIIPRSPGGKNSWENIVIAFSGCNCRKGNKTPVQAGMKLRAISNVLIPPTVAFAEQFWQEKLNFEAVKF